MLKLRLQLVSAFQGEEQSHGSSQEVAMKATELLAEAHAENEKLLKTTDKLIAQNAYLMKTIAAVNDDVSKAHETVLMVNDNVTLLNTEITRL